MFDWLQWGAMGLLGAVMVGIGLYLRTRLDKDQQFLHELIVDNRKERASQAAAWQQMMREMINTNSQVVEAMQAIQGSVESSERQSAMRDAQVAHVLEQICQRLEASD